jgi:hypothetical protein
LLYKIKSPGAGPGPSLRRKLQKRTNGKRNRLDGVPLLNGERDLIGRIISAGLIDDDAVVACNGVTACDQTRNAVTAVAIPMVPVENNILDMTESFVFVNAVIMGRLRFRTLPLPSQNGVVQNRFVSSKPIIRVLRSGGAE